MVILPLPITTGDLAEEVVARDQTEHMPQILPEEMVELESNQIS
jgi:hypothetical protein